MKCSNCHISIENDSIYCGNCGIKLRTINPLLQELENNYHKANIGFLAVNGPNNILSQSYKNQYKYFSDRYTDLFVLSGLAFLGIAGSFFIPLVGIVVGIIVLVLAFKASLKNPIYKALIIGLSVISLLVGIAVWQYAINNFSKIHNASMKINYNKQNMSTVTLATPCYDFQLNSRFNIYNKTGSCSMEAYNNASMQSSNNIYKVIVIHKTVRNISIMLSRKALEADVTANLKNFNVTKERITNFKGSTAYSVNAENYKNKQSIEEVLVFHKIANGYQMYLLINLTSGSSASVRALANNWQWK